MWIGTEDGEYGLRTNVPITPGVGYPGGGPYTLAQLIDRLLHDIIAPAITGFADEPRPGLLRLIENTPQQGSTTYTREQLELAPNEPPSPK